MNALNLTIFISYNRRNQAFVDAFVQNLKDYEVNLLKGFFFDQDKLEGGQLWTAEIQQALTTSDACLVFIGDQGIGEWQNKEVLTAIGKHAETKGEYQVIPIIVPHSNREQVQKNFPWFLADFQWIEFTSETDPDAFLQLADCLNAKEPTPLSLSKNDIPYKGLDFFDVDDAPIFFGRTFDINWIFYKKLRLDVDTIGSRFLAVVGDSGSGKSSFARAGLLATLKARRFAGSDQWLQLKFSPESSPLLKLAATLQANRIISDAKKLEDESLTDPKSLRRALEVYGKRVVLFVDQFEEVITQCKDYTERKAFLAILTEGLRSKYLVWIITLRSDFFASFAPFGEFADLLEANNYTLTGLDFQNSGADWERYIRSIIQKPAKLAGVEVSRVLANQMMEDSKRINGILPALELALVELWKRRRSPAQIDSVDYDSLARGKGIAGIIEEHADQVWSTITQDGKDQRKEELMKAIFIRLVELTNSKEDVRKTLKKADLEQELAYKFDSVEIEKMLDDLSGKDSRLIRVKEENNASWIDVIHEVLIRQWEKLRGWLDERREAIIFKNRLEQYIVDQGDFYTGSRLTKAEEWVIANQDITNKQINDFVKESRQRVNQNNYKRIGSAVAIFLVAFAGWYYFSTRECQNCEPITYWQDRNYDTDNIHKLTLTGTQDLQCIVRPIFRTTC